MNMNEFLENLEKFDKEVNGMNMNELLENLEKLDKEELITLIKKQQYSLENMKTGFDDTIGKLEAINREYMELSMEFEEFEELQEKYNKLEMEFDELQKKYNNLEEEILEVPFFL